MNLTNKKLIILGSVMSVVMLVASFGYTHSVNSKYEKARKSVEPVFFDETGNKSSIPPVSNEESEVLSVDDSVVTYVTNEELIAYTEPTILQYHVLERITPELEQIILMDEDTAWEYCTGGVFTSYPRVPYRTIVDKVNEIYNTNVIQLTVDVWYWEDPDDETNFNKVTRQKVFTVNRAIADLVKYAFDDIYNDPSQPIINLADTGMGAWVRRGKNHNSNNTLSSHSIGTSIDINPSTGTFNVDGVTYGNGYKNKAMPYDIWVTLPETHKKYNVLYDGCPIVEIFKSYGFYWGGDWKSGTDPMHIAFLGDGHAREVGINNYLERK